MLGHSQSRAQQRGMETSSLVSGDRCAPVAMPNVPSLALLHKRLLGIGDHAQHLAEAAGDLRLRAFGSWPEAAVGGSGGGEAPVEGAVSALNSAAARIEAALNALDEHVRVLRDLA